MSNGQRLCLRYGKIILMAVEQREEEDVKYRDD